MCIRDSLKTIKEETGHVFHENVKKIHDVAENAVKVANENKDVLIAKTDHTEYQLKKAVERWAHESDDFVTHTTCLFPGHGMPC